MNLQTHSTQITVQHEFLYSTQRLSFKVGGITLDGSKFTGVVTAGTVVQLDATSGLAVPYVEPTAEVPNTSDVYVVAHDVVIEATDVNYQTGAVEEGYLRADKITGVVDTAKFEEVSKYRFRVK